VLFTLHCLFVCLSCRVQSILTTPSLPPSHTTSLFLSLPPSLSPSLYPSSSHSLSRLISPPKHTLTHSCEDHSNGIGSHERACGEIITKGTVHPSFIVKGPSKLHITVFCYLTGCHNYGNKSTSVKYLAIV
jgi:hypothetical protein